MEPESGLYNNSSGPEFSSPPASSMTPLRATLNPHRKLASATPPVQKEAQRGTPPMNSHQIATSGGGQQQPMTSNNTTTPSPVNRLDARIQIQYPGLLRHEMFSACSPSSVESSSGVSSAGTVVSARSGIADRHASSNQNSLFTVPTSTSISRPSSNSSRANRKRKNDSVGGPFFDRPSSSGSFIMNDHASAFNRVDGGCGQDQLGQHFTSIMVNGDMQTGSSKGRGFNAGERTIKEMSNNLHHYIHIL